MGVAFYLVLQSFILDWDAIVICLREYMWIVMGFARARLEFYIVI